MLCGLSLAGDCFPAVTGCVWFVLFVFVFVFLNFIGVTLVNTGELIKTLRLYLEWRSLERSLPMLQIQEKS